jgi:flagellar hook assembly protein FlgD
VTGTDDRQVTTSAQRTFSLDDTLSSLAVKVGRNGLPTATFELTRTANVVVQIQRLNGVPVATLRSGQRPPGPEHATWRGRIAGRRAPAGRYQVSVQAKSTVGTSSLAAPFSLRAHTRH